MICVLFDACFLRKDRLRISQAQYLWHLITECSGGSVRLFSEPPNRERFLFFLIFLTLCCRTACGREHGATPGALPGRPTRQVFQIETTCKIGGVLRTGTVVDF